MQASVGESVPIKTETAQLQMENLQAKSFHGVMKIIENCLET